MANSRENPAYGWVVLNIFTLNYGAVVIGFLTLGLLLPDISEEFSLSPSQQGWLASSLLIGNLIFELPLNWWLSRYRPWSVSSIAFLAATLMIALHGWSPTFVILLLARIGLGLFYLSTQPPRTMLILQWIPRQHIGLANGVLFSVLTVVEGLGFIVIPLILMWLGDWRTTLYAWTGVCLALNGVWLFVGRKRRSIEDRERSEIQIKTPLGSLFRYREPWLLGLGMAGTVGSLFAFNSFWPTFTKDEYGTPVTMAGLVIGTISLAGAPAMLGATIKPIFARHRAVVFVICGLGISLSYVGTLFTSSKPLLLLLGVFNGLSHGYTPLLMASLYGLPGIKPREVAVAVALVYTVMWGGASLGPLLAGFIQEATDNLRLALIITSMGPLLLSLAGLALAGRRPRAAPTDLAPVTDTS